MMKVLIVSFYDDNYGDILIRVCFENILKTVFVNLKITNYIFNKMSLKDIDVELIYNSDIIFFAGGGLFGLSYLNFFDYLDEIVNIADEKNIPVIFSSIGINNMDISLESKYKLENLLSKKCIKAISVRENITLFNEYAKNCNCNIVEVCDPAVWTKYVYDINKSIGGKNKTIGINVVRGGLFKDNNKNWTLADEEKYLMKLKKYLDELGYNYLFYINGSFLDDNALRYIAHKNNIPEDKIIYNNTTKDLVNTISQFDFVIAIRMHSSIIAYSLEIPCYNLVWNDKIPLFYQNINYTDRVIALDDDMMIEKILNGIDRNVLTKVDHKYMMSLYEYLFEIISKLFNIDNVIMYDFDEVCSSLNSININDEDISDLKFKLKKGSYYYTLRFEELKDEKIKNKNLNKKLANVSKKLSNIQSKLNDTNQKLDKTVYEYEKIKKSFDRQNKHLLVKIDKKMRRIYRKIKNLLK